MSRKPALFNQADLTRALKAMAACGMNVTRTEIAPDGRLIIFVGSAPISAEAISDLDAWRAKRRARAS